MRCAVNRSSTITSKKAATLVSNSIALPMGQETITGMTPTCYPQNTEIIARDMTSRLQCVEDDLEESLHEQGVVAGVSPMVVVKPVPLTVQGLVRPVAVKVVRPVPRRVTQQFYDEAYQEGLSIEETRKAARVAQDWHRKWTQQDEEGHTMPHDQPKPLGALPQQYAYQPDELPDMVLDRLAGARNPSPEAAEEPRKRGRWDEEEKEEDDMPVLPQRPQPVRPAAPPLLQILWDNEKQSPSDKYRRSKTTDF